MTMRETGGFRGGATSVAEIPVLQALQFQRPHVFEQIRGPGAPRILELRGDDLIVGRHPDSALHFASASLSRQHLRLRRLPGGYRLQDLDSANGVFLNGLRVHGATLREGDMLQLGEVVLVYHEGK